MTNLLFAQQPAPMAANIPAPNDDWCAVENDSLPDPPGVYSKSIDPTYLVNNFDPVYFNIFFWHVRRDDGTSSPVLNHNDYDAAVEKLNEEFSSFGICFNLIGYDFIDKTEYYHSIAQNPDNFSDNDPSPKSFGQLINFAKENNYYKENVLNVYNFRPLDFAGIAYSYRNYLGVGASQQKNDPRQQTFIHEMGHTFNLRHTHQGYSTSSCEHVTRDMNDPNYNATATQQNGLMSGRGDNIHDTNAVPDLRSEQRNHGREALKNAGFSTSEANAIINNDSGQGDSGFANHPQLTAIESALLIYGFTQAEVNQMRDNGAKPQAYIDEINCMYNPDNRINNPNSPFFKDCQGTPYQILNSDIENHMSYSMRACRYSFTTGQKIRMHEAIIDDRNGEFEAAIHEFPLDLYVRDHEGDIGQEPNIHTDVYWNSPDIWVRNAADGQPQHQNPNFGANPNYIYVRVTNKSCVASTGEEEVKIYWAKADTGHGGSALWLGQITAGPNSTPLGGSVGTISLPIIDSGDETIVQIPWNAPNPELFSGVIDKPWHFCLMARIVADNDPMAHTNEWSSKQNNNVAAKNVTVVDVQGVAAGLKPGGAISIGNITVEEPQDYDYGFFPVQPNSTIYEEAEVLINLTEEGYLRWTEGGAVAENIEVYREDQYQLIITGSDAVLKNMAYNAGE